MDRRLGIKLEDELGFWFPAEQVPDAVRVYREHYLRLAAPLTSALRPASPRSIFAGPPLLYYRA